MAPFEGCPEDREIPISYSSKAENFWNYSLDVYHRLGVGPALLELQDEAGLDVNCLLFCCWTGAAGYGVLDLTEMKAVLDISREWNAHIVNGLRTVRKALKERSAEEHDVMDLRRSVKNLELKAEQIQQSLLAGVLNRPPDAAPSVTAARANLDAYLEACASPLPPPLRTALEHIASASARG